MGIVQNSHKSCRYSMLLLHLYQQSESWMLNIWQFLEGKNILFNLGVKSYYEKHVKCLVNQACWNFSLWMKNSARIRTRWEFRKFASLWNPWIYCINTGKRMILFIQITFCYKDNFLLVKNLYSKANLLSISMSANKLNPLSNTFKEQLKQHKQYIQFSALKYHSTKSGLITNRHLQKLVN